MKLSTSIETAPLFLDDRSSEGETSRNSTDAITAKARRFYTKKNIQENGLPEHKSLPNVA